MSSRPWSEAWSYTYVDWAPECRVLCTEDQARAKAVADWSIVVWHRPYDSREWCEVAATRPDGTWV